MMNKYNNIDHSQLIPNVNIEKYYQYWLSDIPKNCDKGIVGIVGNDDNPNLKIRIVIDNDFMTVKNYRTICFAVNEENYESGCEINLTSDYFWQMQKEEYLLSSIWHEVGHYHTQHYFPYMSDGKSADAYRRELFEKYGKLPDDEEAADLFAVYYTSSNEVLKGMTWLIRTRLKLIDDDNRFDAANEIRYRKSLIKKISSEDDIKKRMCELCGVDDFYMI